MTENNEVKKVMPNEETEKFFSGLSSGEKMVLLKCFLAIHHIPNFIMRNTRKLYEKVDHFFVTKAVPVEKKEQQEGTNAEE